MFKKIKVYVLPRIFSQKIVETQVSWSVMSLFFNEILKKFACLKFNFSVLYKYFTFPRLVKIPSVFILPLNNQRKLGNIWRATLHLSGLGWITYNKAMYSSMQCPVVSPDYCFLFCFIIRSCSAVQSSDSGCRIIFKNSKGLFPIKIVSLEFAGDERKTQKWSHTVKLVLNWILNFSAFVLPAEMQKVATIDKHCLPRGRTLFCYFEKSCRITANIIDRAEITCWHVRWQPGLVRPEGRKRSWFLFPQAARRSSQWYR